MGNVLLLAAVLLGCKAPEAPVETPSRTTGVVDTSSSPTTPPSTADTAVEVPLEPERPFLALAGAEAAAGAHFWAVYPDAPDAVTASIAGVPLVAHPLTGNRPVVFFQVPLDQPPGPVVVELRETLNNGYERREIEVHAPLFVDVAAEVGLAVPRNVAGWKSGCAVSLGGLAFVDTDLDGDQDVFVGDLMAPSTFLRNHGDVDADGLPDFVAEPLVLPDLVASISVADYDNDGDPDVFFGRRGANVLLQNQRSNSGVDTWVDVTASVNLAGEGRTTSFGFGDPDADADLDVYVVNHRWCYPSPVADPSVADQLYENEGGAFTDITKSLEDANGRVTGRYGFVAMWVDVDRDLDSDLVVVNDWATGATGPSVIWENVGPKGEIALQFYAGTSSFAGTPDALGKASNPMGLDVGDLNLDGLPDFVWSNIGPNALMVGAAGPGHTLWENVAPALGTSRIDTPWGETSVTWASHLFDFDNDGDLDVLYIGGVVEGTEVAPNAFFENVGTPEVASFVERTWSSGLDGLEQGHTSALVDIDADGFLDVAVAHWDTPLQLMHNLVGSRNEPDRHWVRIVLEGDGVSSPRDPFGAVVELSSDDGRTRTCFYNERPGMSAAGEVGCHFGLGSAAPTAVRVTWPDGRTHDAPAPPIDAISTVTDIGAP